MPDEPLEHTREDLELTGSNVLIRPYVIKRSGTSEEKSRTRVVFICRRWRGLLFDGFGTQLAERRSVEAPGGFEPPHRSFADCSLTTWVRRLAEAAL